MIQIQHALEEARLDLLTAFTVYFYFILFYYASYQYFSK